MGRGVNRSQTRSRRVILAASLLQVPFATAQQTNQYTERAPHEFKRVRMGGAWPVQIPDQTAGPGQRAWLENFGFGLLDQFLSRLENRGTDSCKESRAYSVEDGKQHYTFKPTRPSYFIIAAVTPDGKSAFTGAGDRTTPEWDLKTGEMVREWATGRMSKISTSRPAADGTLPQPPRTARRSCGIDRPARKSSRCHITEPCSRWILHRTA